MRMLIIEDEKDIGEYLKLSFEKEGYITDLANNGDNGSYLARTNDYDVIILDNMLPYKKGIEIIKEVREQLKSVPILMISIREETMLKVEVFKAGADDYLTKPFSFQELNARIRAIMRRPYAIKSSVYKIEDFTIDSDKQEVTHGGKPLYLTRKEFLLLECLAKDNGKTISRGMIMEHVWNMNVDPFSNTLETHILNLRRKMGKKGKKIIKTVPGRGYKIETKSKECPELPASIEETLEYQEHKDQSDIAEK